MRHWFSKRWSSQSQRAQRRPRRFPPRLELLENRLAPAVITVTTTADDVTPNDGSVSLREAITAVNAGNNLGDPDIIVQNPGLFGTNDTIRFNIPGTLPFQINVGGSASAANIPLPQITTPVVIDGSTQPGFAGTPVIVINGQQAGVGANGFDIQLSATPFSSAVTIKGLVINQFNANGIRIGADNVSSFGTTANVITGDYIGTNVHGTIGLGNQQNGILIDASFSTNTGLAASNNVIGFSPAVAGSSGNVISGNGNDGVLIQAALGVAAGNIVAGNLIGTTAAGTAALGNAAAGVAVLDASGNTVGGTVPNPAARNVISGNGADGVFISFDSTPGAANATANVVSGNYVGVDGSGKVALGNQLFGIEVSGGQANSIGGNVVGANLADGIELDGGAQNNFVQGNFVGLGADGATAVGNKQHGIALRSNGNLANEPGVQNNLIGGPGNTVAFNGSAGIAVFGNPVSSSGQPNTGNAIEGNSVYQNGRNNPATLVGIDLTNTSSYPQDDGVTPNDSKGHGAANDPNNFQNFPTLTAVTEANGSEIQGTLTQAVSPNTPFRLEFFASNSDPQNGIPEGQFFLGSGSATTDGSGKATFAITVPTAVTPGQIVTATATDPAGNTSEFSAGPTVGTANQIFVGKVYHDLLGRVPDPGGLAAWTAQLASGVPPSQVVLRIETDPGHEYYTRVVQGFYQFYLHRPAGPADGSAPAAFVNFLAGGGTIEQLRAVFTSSPEYFQTRGGGTNAGFVNALFLDAFGTPNRVATDPGAQGFVTALNNQSLTRAQVSTAVFNSDEFRFDLVQSYYQQFLARSGAPAEINGWAGLLKQGFPDQVVIADILGSPESFNSPAGALAPGDIPLALANPSVARADLFGPLFSNTALNGRANLTNLDVFRSPADPQPPNPDAANFGNTVLVATLSPFAGVLTSNSFDPRLTVDLNVVNTQGHLNPDFTFRLTFAPPTPAGTTFNQVVTLRLIQGNTTTTIAQYTYVGNQVIPPAVFANNITFPGDAVATGRFIAGTFDDPSFIDAQGLSQFLVNPANPFPRPAPANPNRPLPSDAKNFFGPNANALGFVLEVPTTKLTTANPPLVGVWATSQVNGMQVQRLGRPLVDAMLIPPVPRIDLSRGERRTAFNQGSPSTDVANFRADMIAVLTGPVFQQSPARAATLVDSVLGATVIGPNTGFLPDILTVDLSKQYMAAGNGFFNGRRLRDDATDTMLRLIFNNPGFDEHVGEDNGTRITDGFFGTTPDFPYIGRPNSPAAGPNP
jgi:CSLREA domain-containing protein